MNKSPAFQFYPDKWQSHTRRLSDSAYRVYHELICWMWQSSPDHCSVVAECEAVAVAVAMPLDKVISAFAEINNAFAPLLSCENGRWVSNGLRKEAEKQKVRREKAQGSAFARYKRANASSEHANALNEQCFPSPSPSPSPSVCTSQASDDSIPSLDEVLRLAEMRSVTKDSATAFFNHHNDNNLWLNQYGAAIRWRDKLVSWAARDRKVNHGNNNGKGGFKGVDRNAGTFNAGRSSEGLKSKVR